ncbi:MAG: beta-N-acetylhexosaminidase [Pseudomonadota bacterium]
MAGHNPLHDLLRQAAQTLMVGVPGTEPTPELIRFIEDLCPGGIILFGRNVGTPADMTRLIGRLQEVSLRSSGLPLLVAIDQEGGPVARLKDPFTHQPGQATLGAMGFSAEARKAAYQRALKMGFELAGLGINLNLAPVLDVRTRKDSAVADRCFSDSPEVVASLGVETINGFQEANVAACAKHFPGHGDTPVDSHRRLPQIDHGPDRLRRVELVPYRAAIDAGVAAVMTTHILYRALDATLPATLSPAVVTGLLRTELGFGGLVFSDDLQMGAIVDGWGLAEAAELALRAGCDQLLVCNMLRQDDPRDVLAHLVSRLETDADLREKTLAGAVRRITEAKRRWATGRPGRGRR